MSFKDEYQHDKTQIEADKYNKQHNSYIRHPIQHTKEHYSQAKTFTQSYWQRGQQLGEDRLHHKPQYIYSDKQIRDYAMSHTNTWQKVLYATLFLGVLFLIIWGALN